MGNEISVEKRGKSTGVFEENKLAQTSKYNIKNQEVNLGELIFVSSFPPRECGIASYTHNLVNALKSRFCNNFAIKVCALQPNGANYYYPPEVTSVLNVSNPADYKKSILEINLNSELRAVIIQHEFDLFRNFEQYLVNFINDITKPVIVVFHTVIENPPEETKNYIRKIAEKADKVIVMAAFSEKVLEKDYHIPEEKIEFIPYGTHLINHSNNQVLKEKYKLTGKSVLSNIGLLSPGKGIETVIEALPAVVKSNPGIVFLVIGKTHPEELKTNGEKYRASLEAKVKSLKLQSHVKFLNIFSSKEILQEYFQLSDICIFSSTDPNRPMSGMFSFAASCGCAILSTPTPHAYEFLGNSSFIYKSPEELAGKINLLLDNPGLKKTYSESIYKKAISSIWENSAFAYFDIFNSVSGSNLTVEYNYPPITLDFPKWLTDKTGILHTTYQDEPDLRAGYTLDDNALALFVFCMHFKITGDINDITYIRKYLKFIYHCFQPSGEFYKYVDYERKFTPQNYSENLEETQAKALWALGYLFSMKGLLPSEMTDAAGLMFENAILRIDALKSAKPIAYAIKGLYYYYSVNEDVKDLNKIKSLANQLVEMFKTYSTQDWKWFEPKFSSSTSILPGALLNTWLISGEPFYKDIAQEAFEFIYSRTFANNQFDIKLKEEWVSDGGDEVFPGEKPCDIAFAVITLSKFYLMCKDNEYFERMDTAFKWFLGNNRLKKMIYNPVSGGCFNGLDSDSVILSQTADSALCYNLARMIVEKYKFNGENHINQII